MKLTIAVIHGIGSQKPGYSKNLQKKLTAFYEKLNDNYHADDLIFQEIYWADILEQREDHLYSRINYRNDLHYHKLRRFFIDYLGDVIAYQPLDRFQQEENSIYRMIHERVNHSLNALTLVEGVDQKTTPLICLAHSLGTIIMSNYFWDQQQDPTPFSFSSGENLVGFMTFGSPIALWSLRYPAFNYPIQFPPPTLKEPLRSQACWYNFYDKDDVIACPLKQLNPAYNEVVTADIQVNVGSPLKSWEPLSHEAYWDSSNMLKPIAEFLGRLQE